MLEKCKELVLNWVSSIANQVNNFIAEVEKPYTFEDMVRYFVNNKPDNMGKIRGALLREKAFMGYKLTCVFIDADNSIVVRKNGKPYGESLNVRSFDSELEDHFGDSDMIILE